MSQRFSTYKVFRIGCIIISSAFLFLSILNASPRTAFADTTINGYAGESLVIDRNGVPDMSPTAFTSSDKSNGSFLFWCSTDTNTNTNAIYKVQIDPSTGATIGSSVKILSGTANMWDSAGVCEPSVVQGIFKNAGSATSYQYALYYTGSNDGVHENIGVAFSNDLTTWVKRTNPVIYALSTSNGGISRPSAIRSSQTFLSGAGLTLFYNEGGQITYRTSTDGSTFSTASNISASGLDTANIDDAFITSATGADRKTYWYITTGLKNSTSCSSGNTPHRDIKTYTTNSLSNGFWREIASVSDSGNTSDTVRQSPSFLTNGYGALNSLQTSLPTFYSRGTCTATSSSAIYFTKGTFPANIANGPYILINSPTDLTTVKAGDSVTINFTASQLNTQSVTLQLLKNNIPYVQIAAIPTNAGNTNYQTTWTVPNIASGNYSLTAFEGYVNLNNNAVSDAITINIGDPVTLTPININPDDVIYDSTTNTYHYKNSNDEAAFQAQLAQLQGAGGGGSSGGNAAIGAIGDAVVNSAGACVGTLLAGAVKGAITGITGGVVEITNIPVNNVTGNAKDAGIGWGAAPSWDSIGWCIGSGIIRSLTTSIVTWINNDFELPDGSRGSSYLKNPERFFLNLADRTAGQFIDSLRIGGVNLCQPFSLKIRLGLLEEYRSDYRTRATCTLSRVVNNMQGFINGDFKQGGWAGWFEMTQNPANNYYGATLLANDELGARISSANNQVTLDLNLGQGFLSFRGPCKEPGEKIKKPDGTTVNGPCKVPGDIKTPGAVIKDQLTKSLGSSVDRLVAADEFDEVVSALINALLKKALGGLSSF